jgi:D-alanyl-lipoteichoic acid acyltransferase DltB (MBOAT superfamily)
MLFQSQAFVLGFLPIAIACYYAAASSERARQTVLIIVSLVFYGWWDARFIPLLVGQITATWLVAYFHKRTGRTAWLYVGIVLNLFSLATFKYLNFLLGTAQTLLGVELPHADVVLPIGISFFSFQLISYLVDRLRDDAPVYPFRPFALFVLFFPHLIAGPIVRHNELVPQLALDPRRPGLWFRTACGLALFALGFAKKVLVADALATRCVDPLFNDALGHALTFTEAWNATLGFSVEIFLDFSAYTEMAIGIALMFGLLLPDNFRRPYLATDLRDFWRRWHITLSNFIRDYLYIPLGGSRHGDARYVAATLGSMAICGLWHGAGWTYVAWGVWHGIGLAVCRFWQRLARPMPTFLAWTITMLFVLGGWVLFRAANFTTAVDILRSMAGLNGFGGRFDEGPVIAFGMLLAALVPSAHEIKDNWIRPTRVGAIAVGLLAAFCILEVGKGAPVNFIYFRF